MKIFTSLLGVYTDVATWATDVPFVSYYADMHITQGTASPMSAKPFASALHVELVTENYLSANDEGGNNNPLTIVSPEYAPYAYAGNAVIAFITTTDGGLAVAQEELEDDFEYLPIYKVTSGVLQGYLVWGTYKVTKTDFYSPKLQGTITTCKSWNPIKGLSHTSLDYSEKIAQVVEG